MNRKVSKMIRRFRGDRQDKRQWHTFDHVLRGRIRAEFENDSVIMYRKPSSWPSR